MLQTIFGFLKKRWLIFLFLGLYFIFALLTYKNYGNTVDEFFVYTRGRYFYIKVRGNDPLLQKGFAIHDRDNDDMLFNNSTYPAFLYAFNGKESYEKYHLLNLLFASMIFYVFYELLLYLYKKPVLAIIGLLFLLFTPRFFGDIPANPKDTPFAILYFLSLTAIFFSKNLNQKLRILILGIFIGLTTSLRIIGFSLLIIYPFFIVSESIFMRKKSIIPLIKDLFFENILIFIVAFLIFLMSYPYVAADPFNHFVELINIDRKYPWYGEILFFGKNYTTAQRPFSYLFAWIAITTPIFILLLMLVSFFQKLTKNRSSLRMLILISIGIQIILYGLIHPVVYNGLRHYLFLLPQIVMLAAICFLEIVNNKKLALIVTLFVLLNIGLVTKSYIDLHPYEYVYYNEIIGGLHGAQGLFRLDYWGASEKEALFWLNNYLKDHKAPKANIYVCSKSDSLAYYLPWQNDVNRFPEKAQYIVYDNQNQAVKIISSKKITLLHVVNRQNTPLQFIYQVSDK